MTEDEKQELKELFMQIVDGIVGGIIFFSLMAFVIYQFYEATNFSSWLTSLGLPVREDWK